MKTKVKFISMIILLLSLNQLFGQAIADPEGLFVKYVDPATEIDSILHGHVWGDSDPILMFKIGGVPSGNMYTPTNQAIVKGNYTDSSVTYVRFATDNSNLYIGLESNDAQVCKFGDSWEGDGMFMKLADANGELREFKLYWNAAGVDPDIVVESGGANPAPDSSYVGYAMKGNGTTVNDSTNVDSGYVAILKISLDSLGYTSMPNTIQIMVNIFDPDNYSDGVGAWGPNGSFAKQWWGSEWGPETRTLIFNDANFDPSSLHVTTVNEEITVDGNLSESIWSQDVPFLKYKIAGVPGENSYIPTGGAVVKGPYTDVTNTNVKFAFKDMNLYLALESDDKQVCKFGDSWEGDGLFMKLQDAQGEFREFKIYWNASGIDPDITVESGGGTPAPEGSYMGAAVKGTGTVVNDTTGGDDNGYTAELRISLDSLGYTDIPTALQVMINIFDPDYYSDGDTPWGETGSFAKQWWGSEWGGVYRTLTIDSPKQDPASLPVYMTSSPLTIDGALTESDWSEDVPFLRFGLNAQPQGMAYTPTASFVIKGNYTDASTTDIKFLHNGSNLFISLNSNDKQVCKFGDSWEGDGLFMKLADANGEQREFKIYWNAPGVDPDIVVESGGGNPAPDGSYMGAAVKGSGTVVNDSTNEDGGYTAELMINLDSLGFTNPTELQILMNIFDPDNYSDGVGAWGPNGSFAKQWWGSEWGPETRTLELKSNPVTGIANNINNVPAKFSISQNYPNPFNPSTKINFSLPEASKVNLSVYNMLGQKVTELVNGSLNAGNHYVTLNGSNLASGVYIYRIEATTVNGKQFSSSNKMILLK